MILSFVSSRIASNNVHYNVMFDDFEKQYVVCSLSGAIMFKAENEALAYYGIRCIGKLDVFGLLLSNDGFKYYCGKPYIFS